MRNAFAHDAVLVMAPDADTDADTDADLAAPGAAVTVALCGHWEHEAPCPLAPHHSRAARNGDEVRLRVLFAAEPASEAEVRRRIDDGLRTGELRGPDGTLTRWELRSSGPGAVTDGEAEHARRLIGT
jgi:hypothetical protein